MDQQSPADALRLFEEAWEETRKAFTAAQDEFAEKLAGARQTLRSCAGNVEKHKANLDQWSEAANARIAALREHVRGDGGAALQEELDALKAQLATQEEASAARIKELESALEIAKASAAEHAEALEAVKSAGSADADRVKALEISETELKGQIAQLEEALQRARAEADTAKAATTVLESDLAEAKKRLEEAESALSELEQSNAPLKAELDALKPQIEAALAARMDSQDEIAGLREAVSNAERSAAAAQEELAAVRRELAAAQAAREEALAEARGAKAAGEAATSACAEAVAACEQAKTDAEDARKRAELAEQKLRDELAKGTKSALALQLAEAIREAEVAQEELRALRVATGHSAPVETADSSAVEKPAAGGGAGRSAKDELRALLDTIRATKGPKRAIGELLVDAGLLTKDQVNQAVDEQRKRPQTHLGSIMIEKGWVGEAAVAQALAHQCGAEYKDVNEGSVDAAAAGLITERLANQHLCIPLSANEDTVTLLMANPLDLVAIEDIERATGRKVEVLVGTPTQIKAAIGKYYWEP